MPDASIEFRVDDAYLQEYHAEWVAAAGRGWRIDRRLTLGLASIGVTLLGASLLASAPVFPVTGAVACAIATVNVVIRRRARARWLAVARGRLPFGSTVRLIVEDGSVRRDGPSAGEETRATAQIVDTPRRYLFRLIRSSTTSPDEKPEASSVYVPHGAIRPEMNRAAFRALFG